MEIIESFYEFLKKFDLVNLSAIRKNVVNSPSDRNILELIRHIQDRPYVYVKNVGGQTILKLSTHNRDPKIRYPQVNEIIDFAKTQQDRLVHRTDQATASQY